MTFDRPYTHYETIIITEYTKMLAEAREQAIDRMIADAQSKGADAVVGFRFATSPVMQGSAELLAYGTAVKLKQIHLQYY